MRRRTLISGIAAVGASTLGLPAMAQRRQTRIVVGFPPGGAGDLLARGVAEHAKSHFAEPLIVENKPGAGGRLAVDTVRAADPDGMTLLLTPMSILTILPHAYRVMPFNPITDLTTVASLSSLDYAVVLGSAIQASTLQEYLERARQEPAVAAYGSAGAGTPTHLVGVIIARSTGVTLRHVPYRGSAASMTDLISGVLPAYIGAVNAPLLAAHREGKLRIVATTGAKRSLFLPDIPTVVETGIKDAVAADWTGILAPSRTPPDDVERISNAIGEAVKHPDFVRLLTTLQMTPFHSSPRAVASRLKAEFEMWGPVVRASGFSLDS